MTRWQDTPEWSAWIAAKPELFSLEDVGARAVATYRQQLRTQILGIDTFEVKGVPMRDVAVYRCDVLGLLGSDTL